MRTRPHHRRPGLPPTLTSPLLILSRILLLQTLHLLTATVLILFTALSAGISLNAGLVLDWRGVRGDTTVGWMLGGCWVGSSGFMTILLLILLARSKLVPDFAFTILFLNLCITALYTGAVPSNKLWWGVQAVSAGIMVGGGVWACRWRELRPIAGFGGGRKGGGVRDERGGYEMVGRGEGGEEGDGGGG